MKNSNLKKTLIISASILVLIIVAYLAYEKHMSYDIEPHESFNADVMDKEGRDHGEPSVVYITRNISPDSLMKIYEALDVHREGRVAVKLSTGEAGNPNHLDPALIKGLVESVDGTIVECNTAYSGSKRADTAMHRQVAKDHGYTDIAELDILDEDGYMSIPVEGGKNLKEDWVGKNLADYDQVMVLTHFKGHPMGGFGGALKNISIGIASREGKVRIHTGGLMSKPPIDLGSLITNQDVFTESMAEAAKAVSDYEDHGNNIFYISVMNNMSIDCDCVSHPADVDMQDIGILASKDPVALDQACIDLVFEAPDGASLQNRILEKNGLHILSHAQKIGLGSRAYDLVDIDGQSFSASTDRQD